MNDNVKNKTYYAAYGALSDERLVRTLLGVVPPSFEADIEGFELVVLSRSEVDSLSHESAERTPPNFRLYALRQNDNGRIKVRAYELDEEQMAVVDSFNLDGLVYSKREVLVGDKLKLSLDIVPNSLGIPVAEENYNPFLNDREMTCTVARGIREAQHRGRNKEAI